MAGGNFVIKPGITNQVAYINSTILVQPGGALMARTQTNCVTTIQGGGSAYITTFLGGALTLQGGALVRQSNLTGGIRVTAQAQSTLQDCSVEAATVVNCAAGVLLTGATVNKGYISGGTVYGAGSVEKVQGAQASVQNQTVTSGATIVVSDNGKINGTVSLLAGASAELTGDVGGTVNLAGTSYATMTLSAGSLPSTLITGFNGASESLSDKIKIDGLTKSQIASVIKGTDKLVLILRDGRVLTLNVQNVQNTGYSIIDSGTGIVLVVCYLAGTGIETAAGTVPVEQLRVGDMVCAMVEGRIVHRKVVWTGQGNCRVDPALPDDLAGYPVCVKKDALGEGVPARDLYVTAEHSLFLDGQFIPARMLVNGRSVFYDKSCIEYAYYHFETEEHSIVLANGALSESYLDTGNRALFDIQSAHSGQRGRVRDWAKDAAAPLVTDRERVEPIYRRIAMEQDVSLHPKSAFTEDPDLHLETDGGLIVRPMRIAGRKHIFQLPSVARSVVIRSRTARPCDIVGPFVDDRRSLGVLVGQVLQFVSGRIVECKQHLTDCEMSGWHRYTNGPARWTAGDAFLFLTDTHDTEYRMISLEIVAAGPYLHDESAQSTRVDMCAG